MCSRSSDTVSGQRSPCGCDLVCPASRTPVAFDRRRAAGSRARRAGPWRWRGRATRGVAPNRKRQSPLPRRSRAPSPSEGAVQGREIADHVVRSAQAEHDLASTRRHAGDHHPSTLDHEHTLGAVALGEQRLPPEEPDHAALATTPSRVPPAGDTSYKHPGNSRQLVAGFLPVEGQCLRGDTDGLPPTQPREGSRRSLPFPRCPASRYRFGDSAMAG